MGDKARQLLFARYIERNFPPDRFPRVADIAGGSGELSTTLAQLGYTPTLFEKRKPSKKGSEYRKVRADIVSVSFKPEDFDLVVGLHPDGATWHVMRLALEAGANFALVPCCAIPPKESLVQGLDWVGWLEREAERMRFKTCQDLLPMKGKNLVLRGVAC